MDCLVYVFLTQAIIGWFVTFTGGDIKPFEKISLSTLIIIAAGAILLVEALMNFMDRPEEGEETQQPDHAPVKPQMNLKSILMYVVLVVVILVAGLALRSVLPVFRISPWVNLILAAIGFIGLKPIFLRKSVHSPQFSLYGAASFWIIAAPFHFDQATDLQLERAPKSRIPGLQEAAWGIRLDIL